MLRINSNSGEWCSLLVPSGVLIPLIYRKILSSIDWLLLVQCISLTVLSYKSWYNINSQLNRKNGESPAKMIIQESDGQMKQNIMSIVIVFVFAIGFLIGGVNKMSILSMIGILAYPKLLPLLFSTYPGSFTYGEGCIVVQSITLFFVNALIRLTSFTDPPKENIEMFITITQVLLLLEMCLTVISRIDQLRWKKYPLLYFLFTLTVFGSSLPILQYILSKDPTAFIITYITSSTQVIKLISVWLILAMIALLIVNSKLNESDKATTSERKLFHGLIVIVAVTGIYVDVELTYFASYLVLILFIYIESLRSNNIGKMSTFLNNALSRFTDEKDQGSLILTHIYLLIGVFLPLWITSDLKMEPKLSLLTGVLSVGVGDSLASIIGSRYGRTKWPYSPGKSVEGTIASIIAQVGFVNLLAYFSYLHHVNNSKILFSIVVTSLIEAYTTQVDNIVLPFLMYILFNIIG